MILSTERLTLREFNTGDSEFMFQLLNSPGWLKYIGTRNINTTDDALAYITGKLMPGYAKHGFGFYVVETSSDNIPVGMCGFAKRDALNDADLGFALLPEHEGKGYAAESASAVLEYAKNTLGLKRVEAITVPYNTASIKLLEKLGFSFKKNIRMPGDDEELVLYSKII